MSANASAQPFSSDLTAIADLATTAYGRGLLEAADAAAGRASLGAAAVTDLAGKADAASTAHVVGDPGEPAFQNNWQNFGSGYEPLRFYRFGPLVIASGTIKRVPTAAVGGESIFLLPVGFRPAYSTLSFAGGRTDIMASGEVRYYGPNPASSYWVISSVFMSA